MAFKKQLVTSCKQAIWGEILGGNAPNYAICGKYQNTISSRKFVSKSRFDFHNDGI